MQLADTFQIARPLDEAWRVLHDPARLAPCVPGAHLTEVRADEYHGIGTPSHGRDRDQRYLAWFDRYVLGKKEADQ